VIFSLSGVLRLCLFCRLGERFSGIYFQHRQIRRNYHINFPVNRRSIRCSTSSLKLEEKSETSKEITMKQLRNLGVKIAIAAIGITFSGQRAIADAVCPITNFEVHQYEYGTPFIVGNIGGNWRYLYLCTGSGTTNTCDSEGTNRNVSMAITAYALGKPLHAYFGWTVSSCSAVVDYTRPYMFRLIP
jgi:hypothetical protein